MSDICSKLAFYNLLKTGKLSERRKQYLEIFIDAFPNDLCVAEAEDLVSKKFPSFKKSSRGFGARVQELGDMGLLRKSRLGKSPVSGNTVNFWIYTEKTVLPKVGTESVCCPKCKGKGTVNKKIYKYEEHQNE